MASAHDFTFTTIDNKPLDMKDFAGQLVLVVNTASFCGFTPQYEGLEKLYERYREQGLVVLGFPANDFAGQEPGTNEEIADFCQTSFGVQFPMFEKIAVTGDQQHPLYRELTSAIPSLGAAGDQMREQLKGYGMTPNADPDVLWNFEKFLISRDGRVVARFAPSTAPDDPALVSAIESELAN